MTDGDLLLRACCACPTDRPTQLILADWLHENNEPECEAALRAPADEAAGIIRVVHALADELKRPPCIKLLFAVVVVGPAKFIRQAPAFTPEPEIRPPTRRRFRRNESERPPISPGGIPPWIVRPDELGDRGWAAYLDALQKFRSGDSL